MELIISGIDCSYQWVPSLSKYQESLVEKYSPSPVNVDHPGEVVLNALKKANLSSNANLGLIYDPDWIDLRDYLPRIKGKNQEINLYTREQQGLIDDLSLANDLIAARSCSDVIILQLSEFGSSVIILSQPGSTKNGIVRFKSIESPETSLDQVDYLLLSESIHPENEQTRSFLSQVLETGNSNQPSYIGQPLDTIKIPQDIAEIFQVIQAVNIGVIPSSGISAANRRNAPIPGFAVTDSYLPWLSRGKDHIRRGGLITSNPANHQQYLYIFEHIPPSIPETKVRVINNVDPEIFIISGHNLDQIRDGLQKLEKQLDLQHTISELSADYYAQYTQDDYPYNLCLLSGTQEDLKSEITHAYNGLEAAGQSKTIWTSPKGSYFTSEPLGSAKLAFVYPGAFNAYPGMARDLFFHFPFLQQAVQENIPDLSHSLAEEYIYPLGVTGEEDSRDTNPDETFYQNPHRVVESGISFSVLLTMIMQNAFGLEPDLALGYSLGEASMLWANQIWKNGSENSQRWKNSSIFKNQLTGKKDIVRKAWKNHNLKEDFWSSFILKANQEQVENACKNEPLAIMTIINTANEVVIAGEKDACLRIIDALGCRSLPMPFDATIHHPAMHTAFDDLKDVFTNPTNSDSEIDFYSASKYRKLRLEKDELANEIANMTCQPLDFPRLINQAYQDGARIFLEIGPQKTCSRWIKKILQDKPHEAIPINKRHQSDFTGVLQVLALLISHGVKLDLSNLIAAYQGDTSQSGTAQTPQEVRITSQKETDQEIYVPAPVQEMKQEYLNQINIASALITKSHQDYLKVHSKLIHNLGRVLDLRDASERSLPQGKNGQVVYTKEQITSFTNGDHRLCFGDMFNGFGERRIPRLPNGELQFLDRVTEIHTSANGKLDDWLEGEYDIPKKSWFKTEQEPSLPYVSLMEIALQPCGFLSAAHGTLKGQEDQDLYFRNLDGEAKLHSWPLKQGDTITSTVHLLSSHVLNNVIIQSYSFGLVSAGSPFYTGKSTFGYFPKELLDDQSGLHNQEGHTTWFNKNPSMGDWHQYDDNQPRDPKIPSQPAPRKIWISKRGGNHSAGYLYLDQDVPKDAWFYKAHFYQDPVMPGSLGVETMARALITAAGDLGIPRLPTWRIKDQETLTWKYRGQITQKSDSFQLSIHIKNIENHADRWIIYADGELWDDQIQLYQVDNIALELW